MKSRFVGIPLLLMLIASTLIFTNAAVFEQRTEAVLEPGAQRMSTEVDSKGIVHMVYLVGGETDKMTYPSGSPVSNSSLYQLRYAQLDNGTFTMENITDMLVYRYQYNLAIDSDDNIHTVFVAENYTLFYAKRVDGVWSVEQITQPSQWFALYPTITLGENDEPRIAYAAILREDSTKFWFPDGVGFSLNGRQAIYYQYLVGSEWKIFDVTENHEFTGQDINKLQAYNPGMIIQNGTVYMAFTNLVSLAGESRLVYTYFPENPSSLTEKLAERTFEKAYKASTISIVFTRPTIMPDDIGGIFIAFGLLTKNAAAVIYNDDKFEEPGSKTDQPSQWSSMALDERLSAEVTTMDGVLINGQAVLTWSLRDNFDTTTNRFSYDVFLGTIVISNGVIDEERSSVTGVTQSEQIVHYSPNIFLLKGEYEILFIEGSGDTYTLETVTIQPPSVAESGAILGFVFVIVIFVVMIYLWKLLVKKLPDPDVEEEILPHLINLKDSIARDE